MLHLEDLFFVVKQEISNNPKKDKNPTNPNPAN